MLGQELSNNRRIFSKSNSQREMAKNQKTSTNDSEDILPKKSILKKKKIHSNLSSLGVPSNTENIFRKNKTESLQTISHKKKKYQIKYDLKELRNNINEINEKINKEKNISINAYKSLNSQINAKNEKIKNLAEEQKELIDRLKIIKSDINDKIEKANILILKKKEENKKEENLKKLLNVKEKEIELANKKNENIKKEYERIIKIFNKNNLDKENNLKKELFELNNKIYKLKCEIKELGVISDQHQYCDKHKNELLNLLALLTNAYQFEKKRTNLIDMALNSESEPEKNKLNLKKVDNKSKISKNIHEFHSPKTKSSKNLFNQSKNTILLKNKKSEINLITKSAYNYINNILNNINDECRKESGIINNSNWKTRKKNLFNFKENIFLEKIIPNNFLIKCKERFDNIENENNKLKEKITFNKIKKDRLALEHKSKIELKELKIKVSRKEEMKLNIGIYRAKKSIDELKKKISEINNEAKKYTKMINIKNKENSNLKKRMKVIRKIRKERKKEKKEYKESKVEELINNNSNNKINNNKTNNNKEENRKNNNNINDKEENRKIKNKKAIDLKEENQKNNINYLPKKKKFHHHK